MSFRNPSAALSPRSAYSDHAPFNEACEEILRWNAATVIADPAQNDCPIIGCNRAFENLTGYAEGEIIGLNCRFLQTKDTSQDELAVIRAGVSARAETDVALQNQRADGSRFTVYINVAPVTDHEGRTLLLGINTELDASPGRAEATMRRRRAAQPVSALDTWDRSLQVIVGSLSRQAKVLRLKLITHLLHQETDRRRDQWRLHNVN